MTGSPVWPSPTPASRGWKASVSYSVRMAVQGERLRCLGAGPARWRRWTDRRGSDRDCPAIGGGRHAERGPWRSVSDLGGAGGCRGTDRRRGATDRSRPTGRLRTLCCRPQVAWRPPQTLYRGSPSTARSSLRAKERPRLRRSPCGAALAALSGTAHSGFRIRARKQSSSGSRQSACRLTRRSEGRAAQPVRSPKS